MPEQTLGFTPRWIATRCGFIGCGVLNNHVCDGGVAFDQGRAVGTERPNMEVTQKTINDRVRHVTDVVVFQEHVFTRDIDESKSGKNGKENIKSI